MSLALLCTLCGERCPPKSSSRLPVQLHWSVFQPLSSSWQKNELVTFFHLCHVKLANLCLTRCSILNNAKSSGLASYPAYRAQWSALPVESDQGHCSALGRWASLGVVLWLLCALSTPNVHVLLSTSASLWCIPETPFRRSLRSPPW